MPTFAAITDDEVAPEAPVTSSLMIRLRDNALAYLGAPSGTKSLFQQTAAPLGWTKSTTHNDKALRIVSGAVGSGGSSAFSTVFGKTATDNFTIAQANLPSVNFTHSGTTLNDPQHLHGNGFNAALLALTGATAISSLAGQNTTAAATNITVSAQGAAASGGSGTALAAGMDIRVQYVDVIIATKD